MSLSISSISNAVPKINNAVKSPRKPVSAANYAYVGGFYGRLPKTPAKNGSIVGNTVKTVVNLMKKVVTPIKKLVAPIKTVNSNKKALKRFEKLRTLM
ncbi:MAG: hypothetical protein GX568_10600 [Candidatus Gastranaerophilales bacterium]|nr:hypothetical protein [Candidatus Gastranaerophilales bacterium]